MILRALEHSLPWPQMQALLQDLLVAMGQVDVDGARTLLLQSVREYKPSGDIADLVWRRRESERNLQAKVTSLQARRPGSRRETGTGAE